jgi:hypothetical protein
MNTKLKEPGISPNNTLSLYIMSILAAMSKQYPTKPPVEIGEILTAKCKHCAGTGQEPGLTDLTCRECIGRGRRKWRVVECDECDGQGKKNFFSLTKCKTCRGRGWKKRDIG